MIAVPTSRKSSSRSETFHSMKSASGRIPCIVYARIGKRSPASSTTPWSSARAASCSSAGSRRNAGSSA